MNFRRIDVQDRARTAIIWLTHFHEDKSFAAFQRLSSEVGQQFDTYAVLNGGENSEPHPLYINLTQDDLRKALPTRASGVLESGDLLAGYGDCLRLAAIAAIHPYRFYWFIEYDVDFSGAWLDFFQAFEGNTADLLGTTLHSRSDDPDWYHWRTFGAPQDVSTNTYHKGFFPISRISGRLARQYRLEIIGDWQGHFEALLPTIAIYRGLRVEDIGGNGPFAPAERAGRFYSDTGLLYPGTFRYRPPVSNSYFSESNPDFSEPGKLWHPIKTDDFQAQHRSIRYPAAQPKEIGPPHLFDGEHGFFESVLRRGVDRYQEFGVGGSTVAVIQAGATEVVVVDSDLAWVEAARHNHAIQRHIEAGLATILHADIGPTGEWGYPLNMNMKAWAAYVSKPWVEWARRGTFPDLVYVDGRFRVAAALSAVIASQDRTAGALRVLVHDFVPEERPTYSKMLVAFDTIEQVGTLRLMVPKPEPDWSAVVCAFLEALSTPE
ncbi:hypothetical protein [Rhodoplanes sp. Z2-YC6860]|uniref:hypothetical protein n=1 Tax=Rhodoplanes sp. Z2-YC6860 TaxID=674703 RepID=UPI0012ECE79E|nr:hypothetical protein [Rhodoplanes sp. Z2-YC6860]